jgi:hypothetical protein
MTYCGATIKAQLLYSAQASFVVPPSVGLIDQHRDSSIHFNTRNALIDVTVQLFTAADTVCNVHSYYFINTLCKGKDEGGK